MKKVFFIISVFLFFGCANAQSPSSGSHIENLSGQVATKKEAQQAVEAIADSMTGKTLSAKYCPACGKHYSPQVKVCPLDGTALKNIDE